MKMSFCSWIFLLLIVGCDQVEKSTYDIIVKDGNVIDLVTGEISQNDIFITNGKIVKIESSELDLDVTAPKIIDASNKFVLPGFWDNHVHFRGGDHLIDDNKEFLKLFIANGITTVRDAGGDLTSSVMEWKHQIESEDLLGPTIYSSGPKLDGPNATWAGSLVVEDENDINTALDSLIELNVDFVKLYDSQISGKAYLQTISEAKKRGLITSGHMPFSVELKQTVDSGIGAIEHLYYVLKGCSSKETEITQGIINNEFGFWGSMEQLIATYQDSTAHKTFDLLKEHDVYVVPTLHIGEVLSYLDEVDHRNDIYLKLMTEEFIETYQGRIDRALNSSEKAREDRKALNMFFKRLARSLSDNGVKLLAGSDFGAYNSFTYPGISLHKELEEMVDAGITPLIALRYSAYNGAQFLKKDDQGSISVGKRSDLVLLNKNPLENIKNTRSIYRVIKGTQIIDPVKIAEEINCQDCIIQN